jgi:murein DD-endopeptidase MepM/ murein hydrolase activator NlpD
VEQIAPRLGRYAALLREIIPEQEEAKTLQSITGDYFFPYHFRKAGKDKAGSGYIESMKLNLAFNPYLGKGDMTRGDKTVCIVDNPGFAPKYKERKGNDYEGDIFKNPVTGEPFAVPTGIFGQWYDDVKRRHEGVDFRGEEGAPVYSFIHAKVVECGWTDTTYGQVIIFADTNGKGMYMTAHLSKIESGIEKGATVSPEDIVGYVGGSAYENGEMKLHRWKPHLHVSYYDLKYDNNLDGKYVDTVSEKLHFGELIGYNRPTEKNPFWHNSGACTSNDSTNA